MNSAYQFFLSYIVPLVVYLKSHCLLQSHLDFLPCVFFMKFYNFTVYVSSVIYFELIVVKSIRFMFRFFFFCMWMSSCLSSICWKSVFSTLCCLFFLVKDQLTIFIQVWSVLLIDLSIFPYIEYAPHILIYSLYFAVHFIIRKGTLLF